MATTLDSHLACVCNCTYDIVSTGKLPTPPENPYYKGSAFSQPPDAFATGPLAINACLVGEIPEGVVLAFRGTLPPTIIPDPPKQLKIIRDWIQDFTADLQYFGWFKDSVPGVLIHDGFGHALEELWPMVKPRLLELLGRSADPKKLILTGHSKGGAMAALAALRWCLEEEDASAQVVTYAAPRAGNRAFADLYNNNSITHERYEYADDLVPHVPATFGGFINELGRLPLIGSEFQELGTADYESVGVLRFIDWSGQVVGDSHLLEVQRVARLVGNIATLQVAYLALCHRIACTGEDLGYMTAVAEPGVCP